jgi:protein-S-isoprenylcysteine O-methyltransferase Ste14
MSRSATPGSGSDRTRTGPDRDQTPQFPSTSGVGEWLFRHRTSLPLPIAVAILAIPSSQTRAETATVLAGVALTLIGELVRLWGVRHIGVISRTRSDRSGPLIDAGPFEYVRNPLYLGNIALWVGFALVARLPWVAAAAAVVLAVEYHAIVRWEEGLLDNRLGRPYLDYKSRVPRWLPRANRGKRKPLEASGLSATSAVAFPWRETLFSERGTLIAIGAGYLLLWIKARF